MTTKQTYTEATGRRKTATARVRISPAKEQSVIVNDKPLAEYFPSAALQSVVLEVFGIEEGKPVSVTAHVTGGGLSSQAEAIRLGIARSLVKEEHSRRVPLKRAGFLKRDPRAKERKKFGLKKARKSAQWSKR